MIGKDNSRGATAAVACLLVVVSSCAVAGTPGICAVAGCSCDNARRRDVDVGRFYAVKCRWPESLTSVDDALDLGSTPDVLLLDLSGNAISHLNNGSFAAFDALQKLNLAGNRLQTIPDDAFTSLVRLRILNLSENALSHLANASFVGLTSLEKLLLAGNVLARLVEETFAPLASLKFLDLSRNPLVCDCHLHWVVNWTTTLQIQIARRSTCKHPAALKGTRLHRVGRNQWHCNWPVQVPTFHLNPSAPQLVFAGDSLRLGCEVSHVDAAVGRRLVWLLDERPVDDLEDGVVSTRLSPDGDFVLSSLSLKPLQLLHQGTWTCRLDAATIGSRSVQVRVLSANTSFCPPSVTANNKGRYAWPQALAGVTVQLPCVSVPPLPPLAGRRAPPFQATQACDEHGEWHSLDTSQCSYVSEVTKVLEQFAKTDLAIARTSVTENMQRLRNYTGDGSMLRDKMDLVFITDTIFKYLQFVPKHKEIGELVVDLVAMIMQLDEKLLLAAQLEDRACSRLVEAVERLSVLSAEGVLRRHLDALAVEDFVIKADSFGGMFCASYVVGGALTSSRSAPSRHLMYRRVYRCEVSDAPPVDRVDEVLESSIRLPATLSERAVAALKLQFTFYRDASLFPRSSEATGHLDVVSAVIGARLARVVVANLSDLVTVTVRTPIVSGKVIPVWWDFNANGKRGDWSSEGCKLRGIYGHLVSFDCDRLANFAVLQDARLVAAWRSRTARYRPSHPVIYVGTVVGASSLLVAFVTYILGFRMIHMPAKNKHAMMNTWFAIFVLSVVFALAVRYTEEARVCQAVGLVLHYLSLVVVFWFLVTASNLLKKVTRDEVAEPQSEDVSNPSPSPPKPMVRFYLVGWGIPLIICGISGAVNMEDYAGRDYCFLAVGHSVGAVYVPFCVLMLLLAIYYLLIACAICRTSAECADSGRQVGKRPEDGDQEEEEEEDAEHSPALQLRTQAFLLLLYAACLAGGAFAVADAAPPHGELLFGGLYALLLCGLGASVVVVHCVWREDVVIVWRLLVRCRDSGLVRETEPLPAASQLPPPPNDDDAAVDSDCCSAAAKTKFCNLTANVTTTTATAASWSGEAFHNPHQNGVARKFFRKHGGRRPLPHSINLNVPVGPKAVAVKASRVVVVGRDCSVDSQLAVSSSSQGLVSVSPSHCSDCSLLIVREEEIEDDDEDFRSVPSPPLPAAAASSVDGRRKEAAGALQRPDDFCPDETELCLALGSLAQVEPALKKETAV